MRIRATEPAPVPIQSGPTILAVGVDIGQSDAFAITTAIMHTGTSKPSRRYPNPPRTKLARVIGVEGIPGVDLADMADLVTEHLAALAAQNPSSLIACAIDCTGLGGPIGAQVERNLRAETPARFTRTPVLRRVVITGGASVNLVAGTTAVNVARNVLLTEAVIGLKNERIGVDPIVPREHERKLMAECKPYARIVTKSGRERLDHPVGGNDDRLASLALAYWIGGTFLDSVATVSSPLDYERSKRRRQEEMEFAAWLPAAPIPEDSFAAQYRRQMEARVSAAHYNATASAEAVAEAHRRSC